MRSPFLQCPEAMLAALLKIMSDGEFHSGERLGASLGVTRAAVWKTLQRLEGQGFPIQRVRGRGYRIPLGAALLDIAEIRSVMPADVATQLEWYLFDEIDSTNAQAMRQIAMDKPRPLICLSERQLAGRGRRGREWASPYGQNIYLSIALPFEGGAQRLEGLSLLVGLALVQALEKCGYRGCELKWPNDVLLEGRKLAGILIEIAGDLTSDCVAVIGVGINVLMREDQAAIGQAWTSLLMARQGATLNRNLLVAEFIGMLMQEIEVFRQKGFAPFVAAWEQRDAWRGLSVCVQAGSSVVEGIESGVNQRGALRLMADGTELLFDGGEVSLRLHNDS